MAPSTPKGLSKEPYTGYQVGDDDQLWTPSIDQVHFPDHISVAVPFKIKDEGVSIKLEDSKDITYQGKLVSMYRRSSVVTYTRYDR